MKLVTRALTLICLGFVLSGCTPFKAENTSLGSNGSGPIPVTTAFSLNCDPSDSREPSVSELKRLNKFEIQNTLADLFEPYMSNTQRTQFAQAVQPLINQLPSDRTETGMDFASQGVTLIHVERHFLLAEAAADFIASNNSIMNRLLGSCSNNRNTDACRRSFLQTFGLRATRRPLSSDDIEHYLETMGGHSDSYRNVIAEMIASPLFYYHAEFGAQETTSAVVNLDAYEKANKISYFLLQSMPDEALFSAAANGSLNTPEGLSTEVDRILATIKSRVRLTRNFADQWLHLQDTADLNLNIQEVRTRLNELGSVNAANTLRDELIQETYDYFDYMIWEQRATYGELMTSNLVFPRTDAMASIYGTAQWNGQTSQSSLVRAPAEERAGLLTRAQFLYTGSGSTRPIMRGVHVYRDFMCGSLSLPPDNSTPSGVVITDDMTDQERTRATTEVAGTSCVGCHRAIINPLGFAFDNFGPFGKYREVERIFHPEGSLREGEVLTTKTVDPVHDMFVQPFASGRVNGVIDLSQRLAQSPDAQACFSSRLWNFAQKQNLDVADNACAVQGIFNSVGYNNTSVLDAIRSIALQPEFLKRKIQ